MERVFVETYRGTDIYIDNGCYCFEYMYKEESFDTLSDAYDYLDNSPIFN